MDTMLEELTGFQRDLLYVIAGLDRPPGRAVKAELETRIGEITHGRLYPNLDALVTAGFVEKGQLDRRTNYYELTPQGRAAIDDRRAWERQYVASEASDGPVVDAEGTNGSHSSA